MGSTGKDFNKIVEIKNLVMELEEEVVASVKVIEALEANLIEMVRRSESLESRAGKLAVMTIGSEQEPDADKMIIDIGESRRRMFAAVKKILLEEQCI